eukprot:3310414-Rhodomonas_salina.2
MRVKCARCAACGVKFGRFRCSLSLLGACYECQGCVEDRDRDRDRDRHGGRDREHGLDKVLEKVSLAPSLLLSLPGSRAMAFM